MFKQKYPWVVSLALSYLQFVRPINKFKVNERHIWEKKFAQQNVWVQSPILVIVEALLGLTKIWSLMWLMNAQRKVAKMSPKGFLWSRTEKECNFFVFFLAFILQSTLDIPLFDF